MCKILYEGALENSFALSLVIAVASIIMMVFGSLNFTNMQQMAIIMASMYGACRLFQKYRRKFDKEYSLMGKNNLGKLFLVLTIFIMAVALYVDASHIARL